MRETTEFATNSVIFRENMAKLLAQSWWLLLLRGVIAIIFGVMCMASPATMAFSLLILFGAWSFVDGLFGLASSIGKIRHGQAWGLLALEAALNLLIGLGVFFWPGLSFAVLLTVIGIKALISAVVLMVVAYQLRAHKGWWMLLLGGLLFLALAALIFVAPMLGVVVVLGWIGMLSILSGIAMSIWALRLRGYGARHIR